jgi:hypothetical protein
MISRIEEDLLPAGYVDDGIDVTSFEESGGEDDVFVGGFVG